MDFSFIKKNIQKTNNDDFIMITRTNIELLKIGSFVKYIKLIKTNNEKIVSKTCYGGILIDIINKDKIYNMILVLNKGIILHLKFLKYKIFVKNIDTIMKEQNEFRNIYEKEIEARKKEMTDEQNKKIQDILTHKKDIYKIYKMV